MMFYSKIKLSQFPKDWRTSKLNGPMKMNFSSLLQYYNNYASNQVATIFVRSVHH
jgi:hypothetical protein